VNRGLSPSRAILPNGATVIAKHTLKTPAVTIDLAFRCGSTADPQDAPGAFFLLSQVIDRGTATRSATDIAEALDSRGISLSFGITRELFSVTCTCLAEDFEPVLALIADVVMAPSIPEAELATRKAQVATSLRQDEDNTSVRAGQALMALMYGADHSFGRPIKGTAESVQALTRERLLALHATRIGPQVMSVVVVGDVETNRVVDCVDDIFGSWASPVYEPPILQPPDAPSTRRFVTVPMMNKSQADIVYGFPSIARADRSYYAYLLMNNILGQYAMAGRLGDSIRERQGLAYSVWSSFDASTIPGPMMVRAGVAGANVDRAVASIDEELRVLRRTGVTGRELAESRQSLVGSLPRALETNSGIAAFLQNAEFFGLGLDYDCRFPTLLTMVTIDEVNASAQSLDPDVATIVVAGPYGQIA
jgi:zinc protease